MKGISTPTTPINKPLLAATLEDPEHLTFPCLATAKIDGIRALKVNGDLVTRTFKPVRNVAIRSILQGLLPEGSDGEILVGESFQDTSRAVMSSKGTSDYTGPFSYYWFDLVTHDATRPYEARLQDMREYIAAHPDILNHPQAKVIPLFPEQMDTVEQLVSYEKEILDQGHEGVMLRTPLGEYKMGRSSLKEGILLKMKKFSDGEAKIIDVEELFHNENDKKRNELGQNRRSTKKEGLVSSGVMGSFRVMNLVSSDGSFADDIIFNIGTGFTAQMRATFYAERGSLIGKIVKYKYFEKGSKDVPRFPVFLGFRDPDDM